MSTNLGGVEALKQLVERGRKASRAGRLDAAWEAYSEALKLPREADDEWLYQHLRALVNVGVFFRRHKDDARARSYWEQARRTAAERPESALVQAAGVRSQHYLTLLEDDSNRREAQVRLLLKENQASRFPEVHAYLLDLWSGGGSGLTPTDPAVVWISQTLLGLKPGQPPEGLEEAYKRLRHDLRPQLHALLPEGKTSRLAGHGETTAWPLYPFEGTSQGSLRIPREEGLWPPQAEKIGVREVRPLGTDGWTWSTTQDLFFRTPTETVHLSAASTWTICVWNETCETWGCVEQTNPLILTLKSLGSQESFPLEERLSLLLALETGSSWLGVGRSGRSFIFSAGAESRTGPQFPEGGWITGAWLNPETVFLASDQGELLRREPGGVFRTEAHRGRVLTLLAREDLVLTGGEDARLTLWSWKKGHNFSFVEEKTTGGAVFLSALGRDIWAAAGGRKIFSYAWKKEEWRETSTTSEVQALALDGDLPVWSDKADKILGLNRVWRGHTNWVVSLARDSAGNWASGCLDGTVCSWTPQGEWTASHGWEPLLGLRALETGVMTASLSWLRFRDWEGRSAKTFSLDGSPVTAWSVNENQSELVLAALSGFVGRFGLVDGVLLQRHKFPDPIISLDFAPGGEELQFFTNSGFFGTWPSRGEPSALSPWGLGILSGIRWSPQRTVLLWGGKNLQVYDPKQNRFTLSLEGVHKKPVLDAVWEEDGERLWTAGGDGRLIYWNPEEAEVLSVLHEEKEALSEILMTRRNLIVRPRGKNALLVHRSRSPLIQELPGHRGKLTAQAVSPAEDLLVTSGEDSQVRFYELPEGRFLKKISLKSPARFLSFHPKLPWLAMGCLDGSVRILR